MAKGSGLMKEYKISEDLAEFLGVKKISRGQMMKKVWKFIKKHGLNEGRTINPDKKLAKIIGKKSIDMFKMVKKLNAHFVK